jgi:hypothetical protein
VRVFTKEERCTKAYEERSQGSHWNVGLCEEAWKETFNVRVSLRPLTLFVKVHAWWG